MGQFGPKFDMVGSASEGTRLGGADEIDVNVKFEAMPPFEMEGGDNAMKIIMAGDGDKTTELPFLDEDGHFSYSQFVQGLCTEVQECLAKLDQDKVPNGLTFNCYWIPCVNCNMVDDELMVPLKHCSKCLPAVTYTKLGACLLFSWIGDDQVETILTMDLIPSFELIYTGGRFTLLETVFESLDKVRPEGWRRHCQQVSKQDRHFLNEGEKVEALEPPERKQEGITLKLLNFGQGANYVVRPSQKLKTSLIWKDQRAKTLYTYLKTVKKVLGLKVSTFFIKKCLVMFLRTRRISFAGLKLDSDELLGPLAKVYELARNLLEVMTQPDIMHIFSEVIDLHQWRRNLNDCYTHGQLVLARYIPLVDRGCSMDRLVEDLRHSLRLNPEFSVPSSRQLTGCKYNTIS